MRGYLAYGWTLMFMVFAGMLVGLAVHLISLGAWLGMVPLIIAAVACAAIAMMLWRETTKRLGQC